VIRSRRRYLVLACRPDADVLSIEGFGAFGARWLSRYLRAEGWAVLVLPSLRDDEDLYRCRVRYHGPALPLPGGLVYS